MADAGKSGSTLMVAGLIRASGSGTFIDAITDSAVSGRSASFGLALVKISGSGQYTPPVGYTAGQGVRAMVKVSGKGKFRK